MFQPPYHLFNRYIQTFRPVVSRLGFPFCMEHILYSGLMPGWETVLSSLQLPLCKAGNRNLLTKSRDAALHSRASLTHNLKLTEHGFGLKAAWLLTSFNFPALLHTSLCFKGFNSVTESLTSSIEA